MSDRRRLDPTDRSSAVYWAGTDCTRQDLRGVVLTRSARSFDDHVADVFYEAQELLIGRHKDYGPGNIANGYPDPLTALVVRMGDKMERIKNLLSTGSPVYGERMRDSWIDVANYGLIGVMVIDGVWPGIDNSARNSKTPLSKENHGPLGSNP